MQTPDPRAARHLALVADFARDPSGASPRPTGGLLRIWEQQIAALPPGTGRALATRLLAELHAERVRRGGVDG
jgi:hypothetical protein